MNKITVLLYSTQLKDFVDISYILNTNLELHDKLDLTFDYSAFETINVVADQIDGFDFSKTIAVNTPCIVIFNDDVYRMYTTNTSKTVKKGSILKYAHKVDLIEASKVLANFPVPNMTITQPQYMYAGKLYSVVQNDLPFKETPGYDPNKNLTDYIKNSTAYPAFYIPGSEGTLTFYDDLLTSPDLDILDGEILNDIGREYNIALDLDLFEYLLFPLWTFTNTVVYTQFLEHTYNVKIKFTSATQTTLLKEFSFTLPSIEHEGRMPLYKSIRHKTFQTSYTPDEVGYISVSFMVDNFDTSVQVFSGLIPQGASTAWHSDFKSAIVVQSKLQISTDLGTSTSSPYIYLDETVDKVLNMVNAENGSSLHLTDDTRAKIQDVLSPELEFQSQTAWDVLEKLANFVDAVPELGLDDFQSVSFTFLAENTYSSQNIIDVTDETTSYNYDDFNTGYETNANNVVKESSLKSSKIEPYPSGWMSVRANEEVGQITEDNACFKVRQPIYKINKMFIRGVRVTITNGTTTKTLYGNYGGNGPEYSNSMWDISNWVIPKERWETYEAYTSNISTSARNTVNTKGNHLYYTKGSYFVEGLGFKTSYINNFLGTTTAPRALFETIMKSCDDFLLTSAQYAGYYVKIAEAGDPEIAIASGNHDLFNGVLARIEYIPLSDVRTTLIKHNFLDHPIMKTMFSNEQDKMNDTNKLGQYTRKSLNKQGNEVIYVTARYDNYSDIPKLGSSVQYGDGGNAYYITSRDVKIKKDFVEVSFELSENFINQSSYVNVASEYRQFEVPKDNTVFRQDKYREYLIMTKDEDAAKYVPSQSVLTQYGRRMCLDHLAKTGSSYNLKPIKYGHFLVTAETTRHFDMPVNGFSIGNTINLQVEMADNYSAGPTRTKTTETVNGEDIDVHLQKYARYTDDYGAFDALTLEMRSDGSLNNTEADADLYPQLSLSSYGAYDVELLHFERSNLAKDARERYGISLEFPIVSDDPNIVIYPGFAKYSLLIHDKDVQSIQLATTRGQYFPNINETHIDRTRIHEKQYISGDTAASMWSVALGTYSTNNGAVNNYKLDYKIKLESGEDTYGYLIYEKTTSELIMGVKEYLVNNSEETLELNCETLYLSHKNNLFTQWQNHPASLISIFPDEPEKITITLNIGENITVAEATEINIYKYSKYKLPKALKIVENSSTVYKFLYWFDSSLNVVDDDYIFTEDVTLYPVFETVGKPYKQWVKVYSDYYDYEITAEIELTSCPLNIMPYITPPWEFAEGTIVKAFVYRLLTEDELSDVSFYDDVILVDEGTEDERYLRPCKPQYFKAVTVTV